jgi:hypothetical protein
MSHDRKEGRRTVRRAFRPALDGLRLEERVVMSHAPFLINEYLLTHPQLSNAFKANRPAQRNSHTPPLSSQNGNNPVYDKGFDNIQTAHGGQSLIVAQPDGSRFRVSLVLADNQYPPTLGTETGGTGTAVIPSAINQPQGIVRAYAMPGGQVGIIVDGSTEQQQLTIDPLPFAQRKGFAHSFAYGEAGRSHVLNIGSLEVTNGSIQAILGFHSADLYGPLTIGGITNVDRIAFNALQPGAAIGVGGSLNTLDINNGITLTSGPGISIPGDLNLLNVGTNVILANGASINVGRFAGLTPQPPKGTGTGSNFLSLNQAQIGTGSSSGLTPSISAYIQGDLTIGPGSFLRIGSGIANSSILGTGSGSPTPVLINGALNVISVAQQLVIPNLTIFNQVLPGVNFVARNGVIQNGVTVLPPA